MKNKIRISVNQYNLDQQYEPEETVQRGLCLELDPEDAQMYEIIKSERQAKNVDHGEWDPGESFLWTSFTETYTSCGVKSPTSWVQHKNTMRNHRRISLTTTCGKGCIRRSYKTTSGVTMYTGSITIKGVCHTMTSPSIETLDEFVTNIYNQHKTGEMQ